MITTLAVVLAWLVILAGHARIRSAGCTCRRYGASDDCRVHGARDAIVNLGRISE